jgi:hypothetical protein
VKIKLSDMGNCGEGAVLITSTDVEGAKRLQTVAGVGWEFGDGGPFALVSDSRNLLEVLEGEGYEADVEEYFRG